MHSQLLTVVREQGWRLNEAAATYEQMHLALLTGLLGNIGFKADDEPYYLGARGIKFYLWPGSALLKKAGRWVMAARTGRDEPAVRAHASRRSSRSGSSRSARIC